MKHIAIDARESGTTTGRYIDKLIEYLHQLSPGLSITILTKQSRLDYMNGIAPNFKAVASPYKAFTFAEQIGLKKQLKKIDADLVHFCMVQQPVFYRGTVVSNMLDLTTVRFRNPVKNQLLFTVKQWVYIWVNKRVAKKSQAIITPTQYVKADVAEYTNIDPSKITVAYGAADPITDPAEPVPALIDKQYLMYIGRPLPHKNLWRLIEAFQLLQAQHPQLHLVLAGKKDVLYSQIESRVQAVNIKNVIFTDFVSEGQLRWLYEHCAAYTFPSLSEGFGLPGLEAMIHGAPVVSSNATCLPEVYGDAAHYFDPLDVQNMSDAINEVLTDKALRQKLITAGKQQAAKYSWQRMAEQTLAVYNKVLDQK